MKKLFNYLYENIEKVAISFLCAFAVALGFNFGSYVVFNSYYVEEKECVEFYKENNYLLNVCERYEEKILKIK